MPLERDIGNWLEKRVKAIEQETREKCVTAIYKAMSKAAKSAEIAFFRNITETMDMFQPDHDLFAEGDPYRGIRWKPLNKGYVKKKRHDRKWFNTGELQSYLARARVSAYFPKSNLTISQGLKSITYMSGLEYERRPFGNKKIEVKITGTNSSKGANENVRPLIEPMCQFYVQTYIPTRLIISAQQAVEKFKL